MGGAVSGVSNLVSGGGNNASADMEKALQQAQEIMKQYYGEAKGYMQPFYDTGKQAMGDYTKALSGMSDPTAYYNKIMSQYSMSPSAQFQQQEGIKAANQSSAASGMLGGGAEQKALSDWNQQLSSRDMQQYYNNINGINSQYMGGEQGLMSQGYNAGSQIGNWGMATGKELAGLQSQIGQAQAYGDLASAAGWNQMIGQVMSGKLGFGQGGFGSGGGGFGGIGGQGNAFPHLRQSGGQGGGGGGGGGKIMGLASLAALL